ncbi:MAG TPA: fibronectin type III domain-containing protein [Jatrophihabitantaceae bacterium]
MALTPTTALTAGDRLVVETGVWSSASATTGTVTDSAGDTFTEMLHLTAADHTEMTVWTAPVTVAGTRTVTVTPTAKADVGVVVLDYSGLSTAAGLGAVDVTAKATSRTTAAATVSSGATAAAAGSNELAIGFYADSGFSSTLIAGSGFTSRANVSPTSDMQMLGEDRPVSAGEISTATAGTGANTYWLMADVVFKSGTPPAPTAPGPPTNVVASGGDGSATLTWLVPANGGSPITTYTITPYMGGTAQPPSIVTGSPPAPAATVTGLMNGMSYTFTVTATNAVGTSPPSAQSNAVTPSNTPGGTWSALQTWPIAPLAMHVLYTGKTVSWDGWQQPQPTVAWDPNSPGTFTTVNAPDSVFCDGAADLPDGRLLVIGGYGGLSTGNIGIVDTNIYDPATGSWSRVADMHYPRWYPTVTELSDGRYLAVSGNSTNASTWADTPEVYDPTTNAWTLLPNINTSSVHEVEYPFSYEVPSGKVFVIGPEEDNSHLLDVNAQTWTSTGSAGMFNGSSIMYRPGKILYSGGAALINTPSTAQNTTAVIDTTAPTPTWRQTAPMNNARIYHTLVMLADGTVLSVGGSNTSNQQVITTGVLPTEIWNPSNETWTPSAPIAAARNYHSTAVLLPDARVLVAGGGHSEGLQDAAQYSSQIYTPSYLSQGPRPTITSAPAGTVYGANMAVSSPDASSITSVNLVSLGADTHQIDMNQHFVPLTFTASGTTLNVQAPSSATIAPPGYYMLFILKNGVPSVSSMVHIAATQTAPGTPSGVVATAGNGSATVTWNAPSNGNSPITTYIVTPYANGVAQFPTTVTGNPPATSVTVSALTNGTPYTFTVAATNAVGTGQPSAQSNAVTPSANPPPAVVQSTSTQVANVSTVGVSPTSAVTSGNRLVVETGVWSSGHATTSGVSDSAGNTYTKLTSFTGSDGAEMDVWTAPITSGGGTRPTITITATGSADVGATVLEYSGLSAAAGTGVLDVQAHATGTTSIAATVDSGATPATTANGELAVGFYADSGFGATVTSGAGWTQRANSSPNGLMEMAVEDQSASFGATPKAAFGTAARTVWLAETLVLKSGATTPPTVPSAPTNVTAAPQNGAASVSWSAPNNGGSGITGYTVTTYSGSTVVSTTPVAASSVSTTVTGLTNGTSYNFAVTATNAVGSGPLSTLSNTVVPTAAPPAAFIQQVAGRGASGASLTVTPKNVLVSGNRLIVETGVWASGHPTISAVTDSAGDPFTELTHFTASDGTEMSIWSAPITAGGGTKPTITATATGSADIGVAALEYSGLAASAPVDVSAHATGTTTSAQSVSSGATTATHGSTEVAIGFYVDSGFGTALTPDPGYTSRVNLSPFGDMDLLVEDAIVTVGATPAPSIGTGANTVWLAAAIVFNNG